MFRLWDTENICDAQACWGGLTVYNDDLIHVSRPFFKLDTTCRAIVLIHEGAHDVGVDAVIGSPHSPNRGDAAYPAGNVAAPAGVTTADRMNTPFPLHKDLGSYLNTFFIILVLLSNLTSVPQTIFKFYLVLKALSRCAISNIFVPASYLP